MKKKCTTKFEKDLNSSDGSKAYEHYILPSFFGGDKISFWYSLLIFLNINLASAEVII